MTPMIQKRVKQVLKARSEGKIILNNLYRIACKLLIIKINYCFGFFMCIDRNVENFLITGLLRTISGSIRKPREI